MMNTELDARWREMVKAKDEYLKELKDWTDEQLIWQPDGGWSANQVTEHLMTAEIGTLGYMKKKSSSGWNALETTGEPQIANSKALNMRLASAEQYKAPSVLPEPTNSFTHAQMTTHWGRIRKEMEEFLNQVDAKHYDKLVFRQPIAGMLNVLQTAEFVQNHIRHHISQLQRIKEAQSI